MNHAVCFPLANDSFLRTPSLVIYLLVVALGKALISAADWRSSGRFTRVRVYSAGLARAQRIFVTERFRKDLRKEWRLLQDLVGHPASKWTLLGASEPGCAVLSDEISLAAFVRRVRRLQGHGKQGRGKKTRAAV